MCVCVCVCVCVWWWWGGVVEQMEGYLFSPLPRDFPSPLPGPLALLGSHSFVRMRKRKMMAYFRRGDRCTHTCALPQSSDSGDDGANILCFRKWFTVFQCNFFVGPNLVVKMYIHEMGVYTFLKEVPMTIIMFV